MNASLGSLLLALMTACLSVNAQPADRKPLRDPTQAPTAVHRSAQTGGADIENTSARVPRHIVVANGRAYLIDRGRRLSVGQLFGTARIERIDDNAVWLRDAGVVRRVQLYPKVNKRRVVRSDPTQAIPPHRQPTKSKDKPS